MGRHPLLERQVRRCLAADAAAAAPWPAFLEAVDRAYREADDDRAMVERAMEISSEELMLANSELRGIIQALPDVILNLDPTGTVVDHRGGAAGAGWTREAVLGRRLVEICGPRVSNDIEETLAVTLNTNPTVKFDCSLGRDGGVATFEIRLAPLGPAGAIAVVRDVTAERRAEALRVAKETAEGASRSKSAFLANMSHELRTPLNAILGYSEMLAEDADESTAADLGRITAAGRHLLEIINDVLDLARIEAGHMAVEVDRLSIHGFVRDLTASAASLADANGNRLTSVVDSALCSLHTDGMRVRQILLNLLGNACKFTRDGVVALTVQAAVHDDRPGIRFSVRDTGIGVAPDQVGRLFQDFVQLDDSTSRRFDGAGLGLSISRRLAELLGGRIEW